MANFAEIDSAGFVIRILVVSDDDILDENGNEIEEIGVAILQNQLGGKWIQCSASGKIRNIFPSIGSKYDSDLDVFVPPQPFPSWTISANGVWQAPVEKPDDGKNYYWDEDNMIWEEFEIPA